jgi:hypothetical protein
LAFDIHLDAFHAALPDWGWAARLSSFIGEFLPLNA